MSVKGQTTFLFLLTVLCGLICARTSCAERLPVKTYTIADGLARDYILRIKQDSHGFLWFCTKEGLSRFDGYGFTNYGVADGLPSAGVNDFLETSAGDYLFATQGGLVWFDPANSRFNPVSAPETGKYVTQLVEDKDGTVWSGTAGGLYRLRKDENGWQAEFIESGLALEKNFNLVGINALLVDNENSLWIATGGSGLFRRLPDGRFEHYTEKNGLSQNGVNALFQDRDRQIWVGTGLGLTLLAPHPQPGENIAARIFTTADGLFRDHIETIFQSSDGRLWVGNRGGLNYLVDAKKADGTAFRGYTVKNGLPQVRFLTIAEDRDNNLWFGGDTGGAMKLPLVGFTSYFEEDGLGTTAGIEQIFSDRDGNKYILNSDPKTLSLVVARFNGGGFVNETPDFPPGTKFSWGTNQLVWLDSTGDWWFGTINGIFRFRGEKSAADLSRLRLVKQYTDRDGIDDNNIFRLFEDANGDIWFSTIDKNATKSLHRWERKTDKIVAYDLPALGIPLAAVTAFANDAKGNLWMGFYSGGVARYHDGNFTFFTEKDGMPQGYVHHLFFDHRKRLWVATRSGVGRVDEPSAEKPEFVNYTTRDGLSSQQVSTITEDRFGRIYLGTGRGIDRLEPDSNRIKHFTTGDGLADNYVNCSMVDADGTLWFGTFHGLSRFVPQADKPRELPKVFISAVRAGGEKQAVSAFGQPEVTLPDLSYTENQLEIDFLSISNAAGDFLRYQYKFDETGADWSAPSEQRTVTLPNLPAGGYRFLVRAVNSDNAVSAQPAVVSFKILPPVWKRWWFIALCAALLTFIILLLYRYRTARLREINAALEEARFAEEHLRKSKEERLAELEQVRARIATDLHDDIGASLTQIAILSEVARQQKLAAGDGTVAGAEPLSMIYNVSNELVGTMSDIVWAINPQKDQLHDLTLRMRRFAADVLTARDIDFEFCAPEDIEDFSLNSNLRREVFLIFKEAVNNIVKHSGASEVKVDFVIDEKDLFLTVADNGRGFDPNQNGSDAGENLFADYKGGNGLLSMRRRVTETGGEIEIVSARGEGTTIRLRMPVAIRLGGDSGAISN